MDVASISCGLCGTACTEADQTCPGCGASVECVPTATAIVGPEAAQAATELPPDSPSITNTAIPSPVGSQAGLRPAESSGELGRLGSYRVLSLLGTGGMGAVYKAEDPALQRNIALKVMLPNAAASPTAKARFLREARAAAKVEHDNVIPIYQVGEDHGTAFLAMPLLRGETLQHRLRREGPLPILEAVRIGREIALGLSAAHELGLIHRDIKPGNIWLEGAARRVKILDFGLARPVSATTNGEHLTASDAVVGTPSYMSPEQARNDDLDLRSDLFSLGVVLYRMLTNRLPFIGKSMMAILTSLAVDQPPTPESLNAEVPSELSDFVMQLLSKLPADRPRTASSVARRLATYLAPAIPSASSGSAIDPWATIESAPGKPSKEPSPRSRKPLLIWSVLVGLLLVGAAVILSQIIRVATPKGTLVIETDDPDVEVQIKRNGAVIVDRSREREVQLEVGEYGIDLVEKKSGLSLTTNKFEIKNGAKSVVRVRLEKSKNTVTVVRRADDPLRIEEVHGVSQAELLKWADSLPVGQVPVWISARIGSDPPLFDAIAQKRPQVTEFKLRVFPVKEQPAEWKAWSETRRLVVSNWVNTKSESIVVYLWYQDPHTGWAGLGGDLIKTQDDAKKALETSFRPQYLSGGDGKEGRVFGMVTRNDPACPRWTIEPDLTLEKLESAIAQQKLSGWRPDFVSVFGTGLPVYQVCFVENPGNADWDFSPRLSVKDYESQLVARTLKGQRPASVVSALVDGKVLYSVVWHADPAIKPAPFMVAAGVTEKELIDWAEKLPKYYVPRHVSLVASEGEPKFDVVATLEPTSPEWKVIVASDSKPKGDRVAQRATMVNNGFRMILGVPFRRSAEPGVRSVVVWIKDGVRAAGSWITTDSLLPARLKLTAERKFSLSYLALLSARKGDAIQDLGGIDAVEKQDAIDENEVGPGENYINELVVGKVVPANVHHFKLSPESLSKELETAKLAKQRPICLTGTSTPRGVAFQLVLAANDSAITWDYTPALSPADFAVELKLRLKTGYRPMTIASGTVAGSLQYFATWEKLPGDLPVDAMEVHGATPKELVRWSNLLPADRRIQYLSARTGTPNILFDAVSGPNTGPASVVHVMRIDEVGPIWERMIKTHRPVLITTYTPINSVPGDTRVFVADGKNYSNWFGPQGFIERKLAEAKKSGEWRPSSLCVKITDGAAQWELVLVKEKGPAFEWALDLSKEDLAAKIVEYSKRGWRPIMVMAHHNRPLLRFLAIFEESPVGGNYKTLMMATLPEYEQELRTHAANGLKLRWVTSAVIDGVVRYCAGWTIDPAPVVGK